jgi:hypothetical protein
VDPGGEVDPFDLARREAEATGEDPALGRDPTRMAGRARDAGLEGGDQSS